MEAPAVARTLSFSLFRPPFPPNPAVRLALPDPRTREADGAGGRAESPVHAGDRVPYQAAQHSVLQTQAAAGVIRHHFAEQVPAAGSRKVSAGPRPRGPGRAAGVGTRGPYLCLNRTMAASAPAGPAPKPDICSFAGGQWEITLRSLATTQRGKQGRRAGARGLGGRTQCQSPLSPTSSTFVERMRPADRPAELVVWGWRSAMEWRVVALGVSATRQNLQFCVG